PVDLAHLSGSLRRSDDAALLHDVDEPARAREADRHLALEHRHRRLSRALDDLDGFLVAVVVDLVATVLTDPRALLVLDDGHVVLRLALLPPVTDDLLDLRVRDEGALRADRLRRVGGEPKHVAAPKELFRTGHVNDRAGIDRGCGSKRDTSGHVRLDESRDDVDRGPLRSEDQVDPGRTRELRDPRDLLLDLDRRL